MQLKHNMIKIYKNTKLRKRNTIKIAAYDQLVAIKAEEDAAKAWGWAKIQCRLEQAFKRFCYLPNKTCWISTALAQYKDAKAAYDKHRMIMVSKIQDVVETVQDLTFQREGGAIHTIDGISAYLTVMLKLVWIQAM